MNKNKKKLLATIAGLALSGTMALGVVGLAACGNGSEANAPAEDTKKVAISTAMGTAYSSTEGDIFYVSPSAGNNAGTKNNIDDPFNFFQLFSDDNSMEKPQAGDTVYVLPGTYEMTATITTSVKGAYNKYIRILNAAYFPESGYEGAETKVTLDFTAQAFDSTARGVQLYGDYTYWYGIDVRGAGDNGFYIGGSYNTIEYGEFYDNRDTGLQLGRKMSTHTSMEQWPSFNLIKNCTSHNNYDNETFGENADGFAAKLTLGFGNVFDGCIAYRNSDDGWDLYAKDDSGNIGAVILYNCVAFENGFLEYTRDEANSAFSTFNASNFADGTVNPYMTRDGDGNGFKLGGSVMEGDVVMYNCLSFQNRMHGVTDNSNPGYLKVEGVTSYDNSAHVSADTGAVEKVAKGADDDSHGNIDVARQTFSYNTVKNVLSVHSDIATTLSNDAYRGSVMDSILNMGSQMNVVNGSLDADTKIGKDTYTSQISALDPHDVFKALPVDYTNDNGTLSDYIYNINGAYNYKSSAGEVNDNRVHHLYRNAEDKSINMHDILAQRDDFDYTQYVNEVAADETFGSVLNKTSWDEYTHFVNENLFDGATSEDQARALRVKETLTLNTEESAVYQDFEVPVVMQGATIDWSVDAEYAENLAVGELQAASVSGSQYRMIVITRDPSVEKHVQLKATITYGTATEEAVYDLTIMPGSPSIGTIRVITKSGKILTDGAEIVDQYDAYSEPVIDVLNGLYPDAEKSLKENEYTYTTTYMYATDSNSYPVEVKGFTPSVAGVYTITHKVTLLNDNSTKEMSYQIYISSPKANVDFVGETSVMVNRYGYTISGDLSSATGILYAYTSTTETNVTADTIKTLSGVESESFRAISKTFQFTNDNVSEYYIYYALGNLNGEVTSEVYEAKVSVVEVDSEAKFEALAGGQKIGDENPSTTIYLLTKDLDFSSGYTRGGSNSFSGLLNGQGHTIKNVTITGSKESDAAMFYKLAGGTVMNVKFDEINISGSANNVGIFASANGGYFYNIAITNYSLTGTSQRSGGLIGKVGSDGGSAINVGTGYPLEISHVSIINDEDHTFDAGSGSRIGGFLGYIQYYHYPITIDNCQVITDMEASTEAGGLVASWEDQSDDSLTITHCYYQGTIKVGSSARGAGMLGYHKQGAGVLRITNCISIIELWQTGNPLTASIKNGSPIVGGYSGNADVIVEDCIGTMSEHNAMYDSAAYTERQLVQLKVVFGNDPDSGILELDFETSWSYVYDGDSTTRLASPYVLLNYLD